MTRLDDILSITESKDWEGGVVDVQVLKEQIKALMLELVGDTRSVTCRAAAYEDAEVWVSSAELRAKIEAL